MDGWVEGWTGRERKWLEEISYSCVHILGNFIVYL
jgi:hypothetical protein